MKKNLLWLALSIFISVAAGAQTSFDFGNISPEEIKLKQCPFDPEADAIVLLDDGIAMYRDEGGLFTDFHVRIKILTEKGISRADIALGYYSYDDMEAIVDLEGMVINFDERGQRHEQPLDRKAIFTKAVTRNYSQKRFAFPSVKAGSIIEYRYRRVRQSASMLSDWFFQQEMPVVISKYVVYVHPKLQFNYQVYKSPAYKVDISSDPSNAKVSFEMRNIPGLREEPYMDSRNDYLQRVNFQLSGYVGLTYVKTNYKATWHELAKELLDDPQFGKQLGKTLPETEAFIKSIKDNPSALEKTKKVYDYVRNNMTWDHSHTWWAPDGVRQAWSKKSGTSGEINLILLNLLREAGVDANPLMVSERYNGEVNKSYPFQDQFNTLYACVTVGDRQLYLDATNKDIPVGVTPVEILNTTGFIVSRRSGGLININDDLTHYTSLTNLVLQVSGDGSIHGDALITHEGYARFEQLAEYKTNKEKYVSNHYSQAYADLAISDFSTENEAFDSLPLKNKFQFKMPATGQAEYLLIPYRLFSGNEKNPFISNNRFSAVNFGWKQSTSINTHLKLPAELRVDELPKSIRIINGDKTMSFTRQVYPDDGSGNVIIRAKIEISKTEYQAEEYPDVKEFYKRLFELLNEPIVLKKK